VERAAAVLDARLAAGVAILAGLAGYYAVVDRLGDLPLWWDVALTALVLMPAVFLLVLLALPLRAWRGLLPVGLAFAALVLAGSAAGLDVVANFAKVGAVTLLAFWFLLYFERLSWVVLVAVLVPLVDGLSVWRGPTRHIVTDRPQVFEALSFAFPVPGGGAFHLGLPDFLFFALFLGAAAIWGLRVLPTWAAMTASFGATMALALWLDPFGLGGLPALPLLSLAFVLPNADLLWRALRAERAAAGEPG
jgi:hypothetical protein